MGLPLRTQTGGDGATLVCAYCAQATGHSPRCSVTKFGVPEIRVPRRDFDDYDPWQRMADQAGDFHGDNACAGPGATHHACDCIMAERDDLARLLSEAIEREKALEAALGRIAEISWPDNNPGESMGRLLGLVHAAARKELDGA